MKLNVQLFARAKEIAGSGRVCVELPESARVADVRTALGAQFPEMGTLIPSLLIAVGTDYADDAMPLSDACEVACFPPVSGG